MQIARSMRMSMRTTKLFMLVWFILFDRCSASTSVRPTSPSSPPTASQDELSITKMKLEVAVNERTQLRTEKNELLTELAHLRGLLAVALKQPVGADHYAFTVTPVQATTEEPEEPVECSAAEDTEPPLSAEENTGLSATNRRSCSQPAGGTYSFATAFVFEPYSAQDRTISVGISQSCGIVAPSELRCWGKIDDQYTPAQSNLDPYEWQAVSANNHVCGILSDATAEMLCWGGDTGCSDANNECDVPTFFGVKYTWQAVSAGLSQTCGILGPCTHDSGVCWEFGEMKCWGRNSNGQISFPTLESGDQYTWQAVTVSDSHSCGIVSDTANLKCWGFNANGECDVPTNGGAQYTWQSVALSRFVSQASSAGDAHTCGIVSGTSELKCWGSNGSDQIIVPTSMYGPYAWKAVSIAGESTCGIVSDATLKCWGANDGGSREVKDQQIDGVYSYDQLLWQAVTISAFHVCGITIYSEVKCWGDGSSPEHSNLYPGWTQPTPGIQPTPGAYTWLAGCTFTTCGIFNPVSTESQISFSLYPTMLTLGTLQISYKKEGEADDDFETFGTTFSSLASTYQITGLTHGTAYQFKATIVPSSGDSAITQVSNPWPTLPADLAGITIATISQDEVSLYVEPLGELSARPIGVKCCVLVPSDTADGFTSQTNTTQSFGSSGPTFLSEEAFNDNPACHRAIGSLETSVVTGYPAVTARTVIEQSTGSPFTIEMGTTDGSVPDSSAMCLSRRLQRCTQYAFQCGVQNIAGWSETSVRSSVVLTLPALSSQPAKPQIIQLDATNEIHKHQFTVVLEAPRTTETNGGWCSEYTFRVHVSTPGSGGAINVITNTSGLAAGKFVVSGLAEATTYTVVVYVLNQAGSSEASDALEVSDTIMMPGRMQQDMPVAMQ